MKRKDGKERERGGRGLVCGLVVLEFLDFFDYGRGAEAVERLFGFDFFSDFCGGNIW